MEFTTKVMAAKKNFFKWKHYESEIITLCVRWYGAYPLSYRHLVEMMETRGLALAHTTIMRWVHALGPELNKRIRPFLRVSGNRWKVDEVMGGHTHAPQKSNETKSPHRFRSGKFSQ